MTYERYQNGLQTGNGSPSSREIQSDVVEIRSEMSKTLEAIAEKLAPKELLTQLLGPILQGGGGTRFLQNLGGAIARNPIPALLIGGGVGYLIYDGARQRGGVEVGSASSTAREVASSARTQASALADRAREGAQHAREGAQQMAQRASDTTKRAAQRTRDLAHKSQELAREQPLVLAGLGLALGAVLAALSPLSRREAQLLSEPAGQLVDRLQAGAHQLKDRVEEGARAAGEAAKQALTGSTES